MMLPALTLIVSMTLFPLVVPFTVKVSFANLKDASQRFESTNGRNNCAEAMPSVPQRLNISIASQFH